MRILPLLLPLYIQQNSRQVQVLQLSNLKATAGDKFMTRYTFERVEKNIEKKKIPVAKIFFFSFPTIFSVGYYLRDLNSLPHNPDLENDHGKKASWKHCGKRRKSRWPAFCPFPTIFLSFPNKISVFHSHYVVFCKCFWYGPVKNCVVLEWVKTQWHRIVL